MILRQPLMPKNGTTNNENGMITSSDFAPRRMRAVRTGDCHASKRQFGDPLGRGSLCTDACLPPNLFSEQKNTTKIFLSSIFLSNRIQNDDKFLKHRGT